MSENVTPKVCLCVPVYNAEKTIVESLESILSQTYRNISIFVVDNASTDTTSNIVAGFEAVDPRVRLYSLDKNIGAEGNFNYCIKLAEGDYTGIFHADDVYGPDIVKKQVEFLQRHAEAGAVFTRASYIDKAGNATGIDALPPELSASGGWECTYGFAEIFRLILRDHNFLICPSALVRTSIYKQHVCIWDWDAYRSSADLGVWLKILERYRIGIIPEPLINYRQADTQGTAVLQYLDTAQADFFLVIEHYLANLPDDIKLLSKDVRNLRFLQFRDNSRRATNCMINGGIAEARRIMQGALSPEFLFTALLTRPQRLANRYRFVFWLYGVFIFFLAHLPQFIFIPRLLHKLKYGNNKKKGQPLNQNALSLEQHDVR